MTGIILQIKGLEDEEFVLHFYIERDRVLTLEKSKLVNVLLDEGWAYYALIDADKVGRGHLMCRVELVDSEKRWPNQKRPVVISGYTGYDTDVCGGTGATLRCGSYVVSFERVEDIPVGVTLCRYGLIKRLKKFGDLTASDIDTLEEIKEGDVELTVQPGDTIVVAIPKDSGKSAQKDNGWGGKIPFSETVMGANGIPMTFNDEEFLVYGEFCIVYGNYKIYIEWANYL